MSSEEQERLWLYLKHGDKDHEDWLREAIRAFFANEERPPAK